MNHCSEEDLGIGSGNHRLISPHEISSFMSCELTWSSPPSYGINPWVFWSRSNDEFQYLQVAETIRDSGTIKEKIKYLLQSINIRGRCCLVQFWAPVIIEDRKYLTTEDQTFALGKLVERLCSYRKHCLDFLIPVDGMGAGGSPCPPGRVFLHGFPELSIDVHHYSFKEYPLRDAAVNFGVGFYLALPVFEPRTVTVGGVREIVMDTTEKYFYVAVEHVIETIKKVDLKSSDMYRPIYKHSIDEIQKLLSAVEEKHGLPCQTWVPTSDASGIGKVTRAQMYAENIDVNGSCQNQVAASAPSTELQSVGRKLLPGSSHQQLIVEPDVANRKTNRVEQSDIDGNDSGNRSTRKRIDREYGITLEDLLQHSGKKLDEVAEELGVSQSIHTKTNM